MEKTKSEKFSCPICTNPLDLDALILNNIKTIQILPKFYLEELGIYKYESFEKVEISSKLIYLGNKDKKKNQLKLKKMGNTILPLPTDIETVEIEESIIINKSLIIERFYRFKFYLENYYSYINKLKQSFKEEGIKLIKKRLRKIVPDKPIYYQAFSCANCKAQLYVFYVLYV